MRKTPKAAGAAPQRARPVQTASFAPTGSADPGGLLSTAQIIQLQKTIGNRGVSRWLASRAAEAGETDREPLRAKPPLQMKNGSFRHSREGLSDREAKVGAGTIQLGRKRKIDQISDPDADEEGGEQERKETKVKAKDPKKQQRAKEAYAKRKQFSDELLGQMAEKTEQPMKLFTGTSNKIAAVDEHKEVKAVGPKSYEDDRNAQARRWASTVVFKYLNNVDKQRTEEIQTGVKEEETEEEIEEETKEVKEDKGKREKVLGISANENIRNEWIRKNVKNMEHIKEMARALIKKMDGEKDSGKKSKQKSVKLFKNSNEAIRTLRHCAKLLRDKYDEAGSFDKIQVPDKVAAKKDKLHAELRLVAEGFELTKGVKRPCVACAIVLKDEGVEVQSTGPFWVSDAALKSVKEKHKLPMKNAQLSSEHIDTLADLAAEFMEKSVYSQVQGGKPTADYDTDSDSDIETKSDGELSDGDMELIKKAEKAIKNLEGNRAKKKRKTGEHEDAVVEA